MKLYIAHWTKIYDGEVLTWAGAYRSREKAEAELRKDMEELVADYNESLGEDEYDVGRTVADAVGKGCKYESHYADLFVGECEMVCDIEEQEVE